MKKAALSIVLCVLACGIAIAAPHRIHVPHGHGTVYVHGYMRGPNDQRHYTLYAHQGQDLSLLIVRGGPSTVMVYFPNGQQDGAPGGVDATLPATGINRIVIGEHHMGQPWRGPFTLKVGLH